MRKLVTLILLTGISAAASTAVKADWGVPVPQTQAQVAPTTPQVPVPQGEAAKAPTVPAQAPPCQSGCNDPTKGSGTKKNFAQKFFAWVTYRPSSGDALPILKVHPYIGQYAGTFLCTSGPGSACGGNCNSAGGRKPGSCAAVAPAQANPVEVKGNVDLGVISPIPQQGQGYPARGCQGGSVQLSDPRFPGSTHGLPPAIETTSPEASAPIENISFKTVGGSGGAFNANTNQTVYVAAYLISRQVQMPIEIMMSSSTRP